MESWNEKWLSNTLIKWICYIVFSFQNWILQETKRIVYGSLDVKLQQKFMN